MSALFWSRHPFISYPVEPLCHKGFLRCRHLAPEVSPRYLFCTLRNGAPINPGETYVRQRFSYLHGFTGTATCRPQMLENIQKTGHPLAINATRGWQNSRPRGGWISGVQMMTTAAEIEAAIGPVAAAALLREVGGARLYIPVTSLPRDHLLVRILGAYAAGKLCERFGGDLMCVPRPATGRARDAEIRRMYAHMPRPTHGSRANRLAAVFGLSQRQILNILAK